MDMKEEIRKGPWTEEEDMQLMWFVGLLGERRWDFIAKVSGLQRTGKSCRLRWVNYLNPNLKRGRLSPQEERMVLELHARWGNRWSRIARKLPGRTDNEIKNYWRTHMRKEAQRRKKNDCSTSPVSSSSASYSPAASTSSSSFVSVSEYQMLEQPKSEPQQIKAQVTALPVEGYPMEKIWDEMASFEEKLFPSCNMSITGMGSPFLWDNYSCGSDALWKMGTDIDEELKLLPFPAAAISK